MIDVLRKLQEIQEKSPEVTNAIASTEAMNPKQQAAIAIAKKEKMKEHCTDFADFLKREGGELGKMNVQDIMAMADKYAQHKIEVSKDESVDEGRMKDIMIGAEEAIGPYVDDDGNLKMPKRDVVMALVKKSKEVPFPTSYEYETAAKMVTDKFDDSGEPIDDMEPAMDAEQPADEGNEFAMAVQKAKAAGMKAGDKFKVGDKEYTLKDSDFEQVNTNTMENKEKKVVKEDIKMTADTPQEANMLMQILQMAGIKPMGAEMPSSMTMPSDQMDPGEMNKKMDVPTDGDDDAMGSMDMAKMRNMVMKPDMEKQEETFANSPADREKDEPKIQDVDSLVNVHSGGLNRQKTQYRKEYPGDNPMAVEDKITEEDLANSLRTQYESFKQAYQEAAKPDYIDLDKDGNKTEPMKKAAKDKEAKDKK